MLANLTRRQKIGVMAGVMMTLFLFALNQTIVATALPRIVSDLNGLEHISWVVTAFLLTSTVSIPIFGKLSDIYGRKGFIILGIIIFVIGSGLAGQSQSMTELIIFRGIQGIGGGAIAANAFAVIGDLFPPAERGRWQGLLGATFGLASVVGPTLGGYLTDNLSWRWCFYVAMPVALLALPLILFLMPRVAHGRKHPIDFLGAGTLAFTLTTLLLALVWGGSTYPWDSGNILGLFAAAAVGLASFIIVELRAKDPVLPLDLFKNNIFAISSLIAFLTGLGMFGAIIYIPLFAQGVIGTSATNSGAIITPLMFGLVGASIITGQVISRTRRYKYLAVAGMALLTASLFWLSQMEVTTSQSDLVLRMVATGIGIGIAMPIFTIAVQNAFPQSKIGVVTASTQLFRQLGGTVGVAITGAVFNSALLEKVDTLKNDAFIKAAAQVNPSFAADKIDVNTIQGLAYPQAQEKIIGLVPPGARDQFLHLFTPFVARVREAMASTIAEVFLISAVLVGVAFVASLFLKEIKLRKTHGERAAGEEAGVELALEEGQFPAEDEPTLRKRPNRRKRA